MTTLDDAEKPRDPPPSQSGGINNNGVIISHGGNIVGRDNIIISLLTKTVEKPLAFMIIAGSVLLTAVAVVQIRSAALVSGFLNGIIDYFSNVSSLVCDPQGFFMQVFQLDQSSAESAASSGMSFYLVSYFSSSVVIMKVQNNWTRETKINYLIIGPLTSVPLICASGISARLAGFNFPVPNIIACNFYMYGASVLGWCFSTFAGVGLLGLTAPRIFRSWRQSGFQKFPDSSLESPGYWLSSLVVLAGVLYCAVVFQVMPLSKNFHYLLVNLIFLLACWGIRKSLDRDRGLAE